MWTVEKVKEELPEIQVRLPMGETVTGHVRGRKKNFATIHLEGNVLDPFECRWKTIANCLNNNKPVIY